MSDIGLAGGVGEEQISDSGLSGAQSFSDYSPSGSDGDNYAQATANIIAEPKVGVNRSNVVGMANYDPTFAAAFDISRGLDPTNNFGGTGGLAVPSYLRPQLPGNKVLNEAGDRTMYYSPVERFMQEDLADIAQSGIGLTGLVGRGLDSLFSGLDFLNNSKAGNKIEDVFEEQKRIEIADLEKERLAQGLNKDFEPLTFPTIDRTNVLNNSFMDSDAKGIVNTTVGKEVASNFPVAPSISNAEKSLISSNMSANNILELLKNLEKETDNVEIDAGPNKGNTLTKAEPSTSFYDGSQYNDLAMQKLKNLGYNVEVPNLPSQFPTSRPFPGTNEVALQRGTDGYYFANASNRKLDIPERISNFTFPTLTEAQVRASDDAGYSFEPTTNLATLGLQRDNTEFIEKANLPPELQGIVGLNTDLDYGQTTPLSVLLENTPLAVTARDRAFRKEQEKKDKEIAEAEAFRKFRASLSPSTRIGGGYGGVNEPVRPNYSSSFTPSLPPLY